MKNFTLVLLALVYSVGFTLAQAPNIGDESTDSPGYFLVWSDEFDGATLNTTDNWFHQTQLPTAGGWFNGELQHYTDAVANSSVADGNLSITAIKETLVDQGLSRDYTSARLNSKYAFTYGRVDVRAQLPAEAGTWPAIWMLGQAINEDGGYWDAGPGATAGSVNWPLVGEIDIMEQFANKDEVTSAVHNQQSSGNTENKGALPLTSSTTAFHTYSMIWNENEIQFLVDDVEYWTYNPITKYGIKDANTWPFDEPQYFLLNVAMGGIGGTVDPAFSTATMEIDYVRVYQESSPTAPTVAAPTPPAREAGDVISIFSDAYSDIAGTDFAPNWGQGPMVSTIDVAGNSTLFYDDFKFQGTQLSGNQDLSAMEYVHIDVWTPDATVLDFSPISVSTGEKLVSLTPLTTGEWKSYDILLSDFTGVAMTDIHQLKMDAQAGVNPADLYIDNIYFYKTGGDTGGGGATAPTVAAPTPPAREAGDVISIFSDAYSDIAGTDFAPNWGQGPMVSTIDVAGNSTLFYDDFKFQGTQLSGNQDLSAMEYVHIDVWTPDATVLDFSPISVSTGEKLVSLTPLTTGEWKSYDILLSDFTGVAMTDIHQLKMDAQAGVNPADLYIDNIYFYTTGGGGTGGGTISNGSELVVNGGFENGPTQSEWTLIDQGGTISIIDTEQRDGIYSASIVADVAGNGGNASFPVMEQSSFGANNVSPGDQVRVTFNMKAVSGTAAPVYKAALFSNKATGSGAVRHDITFPELTGAWQTITADITTDGALDPANGLGIQFQVDCGANPDCSAQVYIDNVSAYVLGNIDTERPVITLTGDNPFELTTGTAFVEPGFTATDNVDGDITDNVVVSGDAVNENVEGTYEIRYNVSDAEGNDAIEVSRIVNVSESGGGGVDVGPSLIANGGFETGDFTSWVDILQGGTIAVIDTDKNGGTYAAQVKADVDANGGGASFPVLESEPFAQNEVNPGDVVTVTFDIKGSTAGAGGVPKAALFSNKATGSGAVRHDITLPGFTGAWQTVTADITTDATLDVNNGLTMQFQADCGGVAGCVVDMKIDNISVSLVDGGGDTGGGGATAPTVAAPTPPAREAGDVISIFSDAYSDIAGTDFAPNWGQGPMVSTIDVAGNSTLFYDDFKFQGTQLSGNQDLSAMEYVHIDVWTPDATVLDFSPISVSTGEKLVSLTPLTTGEWKSYDILLSDFTGVAMTDIHQLKMDAQAGVNPADLYIDNIYFYKTGGDTGGGGATAPTVAAPTPPAREAGDVISIFSDAYSDIAGTDFAPNWGQGPMVSTIDVAGNSTLFYDDFKFQGTQLSGNQDLSAMEYVHIDVWTPDATVLDFSPISVSTGEKLVSLTPLTTGEWKSYDILLSDFTGVAMTDIHQLKMDAQAGVNPADLYIDNIYFYTTGGGGTGGGTISNGSELVVNGGFENGPTQSEWTLIDQGGTISIIDTEQRDGIYSASIVADVAGNGGNASFPVMEQSSFGANNVSPGDQVRVTFNMKAVSGTAAPVYKAALFSNKATGSGAVRHDITFPELTGAWQTITADITTDGALDPANGLGIQFQVDCGANPDCSAQVYIDNVSAYVLGNIDTERPVITLTGDNPFELTTGTAFVEPGFTATDNVDGDITDNVVVSGDAVNENVEGTYEIRYNVSDAEGNDAIEVSRIVNVSESGGGGVDVGPSLIANGGFETGDFTSWVDILQGGTIAVIDTDKNGGTYAAQVKADVDANGGGASFPVLESEPFAQNEVNPGDVVTVTFDIKGSTAGAGGVPKAALFSNKATGSGAVRHDITLPGFTGAWQTVTADITTDATLDVNNGLTMQFQADCGGVAGCVVDMKIDNISVSLVDGGGDTGGGGATAPTVAAPTPPAREAGDVISIFSDAYSDIAGTDFTPNWGQGPMVSTIDVAGNSTLFYDDFKFQGTQLSGNQDLSAMEYVHIDVWTPDATVLDFSPISVSTGEKLVSLTPLTTGEWKSYDILLSDFTGVAMTDIHQLKMDAQAGVNPADLYIDNIYFYKTGGDTGGGGATAPTVAAPTPPAREAGDVISIFSDAYSDIAGTDFAPNWGQGPMVSTIDVAGNSTLFYDDFKFQGTQLSGNQDLSAMEYVHIDVWTPDATVLDFSPISVSTGEKLVSLTPLTTGEWKSYDILLSDFTGVAMTDIHQLKMDAQAGVNPADLYIDNIYFYKTGGGTGGGDPGTGTELADNGDFEAGDLSGWIAVSNNGTITADNTVNNGGSWSGKLSSVGTVTTGPNPTLKQERKGAGTLAPGDDITISFDYLGSLAGAGGVFDFRAFIEVDGGGVSQTEVLSVPAPTGTWQTFSNTFTIGAVDASGGVTFQLTAACGAVEGCEANLNLDNVSIILNGSGDGGGGGTTTSIDLPITFEDGTLDYELQDFGGASSTIEVDPSDAGNTVVKTIKNGPEVWAGTTVADVSGFGSAIPFTASDTKLSVRVYTPAVGIPVRLKVEDVANGAISVETEAVTTVANGWETLEFDFTNEVASTPALDINNTYNKASIFFDFGTAGTGETYYWDDVTFVEEVVVATLDLPITFESSTLDYELQDFGGASSTIEADPSDAGNTVVKTIKNGPEVWAGTTVADVSGFDSAIPFTASDTKLSVRVYTPAVGIPVRLKVEDVANGAISVETEAVTTVANGWETLEFDFTNEVASTPALDINNTYNKASIFFDFGTAGTGETYYWDDVKFIGGTGGAGTVDITGVWKMEPVAGAFAVSSARGGGTVFFSSGLDAVTTRSCFFDDEWTFGQNGSLSLDLQNNTWLETWQGVAQEQCGTPVAPHDGSGTYTYSVGDGSLTVNGQGIYLGLAKAFNGGELTDPQNAPSSITYFITDFTDSEGVKRMTLDIEVGGGNWWRFKLASGEIKPQPTLPITFEDAGNINYEFADFETNASALVSNPNTTGNSSANVMQMIKSNGAVFAGTSLPLSAPINWNGNTVISVKVLSPRVGAKLTMKLEGAADAEIEKATTVANEWETLNFNYVGMTNSDYGNITLIWDNGTAGAGGSDWTFYLDDFEVVPTPAENFITLPLDFESATLNYQANTFGGNEGGIIGNPVSGGINTSGKVLELTKTSGAVTFAGTAIPLAEPINFNGNTSIKIKAYSLRVGETITLKLEGADRSPAPELQGVSTEAVATTTVANQWEELTFDFLGATANEYVQPVLFWDFGETGLGETVYVDDIEVTTTPQELEVTLPVDFESATANYSFGDFNGTVTSVIPNPQSNGDNTSGFVLETKKGFGQDAGTTLFLSAPIDFGDATKMRVKVYSPRVDVPLTFVLESSTGNDAAKVLTTTQANNWETFEFDFTGQVRSDYTGMTFIWENGTAGDNGPDWTFLIDDIEVFDIDPLEDASLTDIQVDAESIAGFNSGTLAYNIELTEGTTVVPSVTATATNPNANIAISDATQLPGTTSILVTSESGNSTRTYEINFTVEAPTTAPTVAAAAPINAAENVVSVFSNAYTDLVGTNFANFGAATFEEVTLVSGDKLLRYTQDEAAGQGNFRVIQLGSPINATGNNLTRFRFDVWFSKDLDPDSQFSFKVANGVDPNKSEGSVTITPNSNPAMTQGQWLTYDFALSALDPALSGQNDIQQIVIDLVNSREVYLDNIFFYEAVPIAPTMAPAAPTDNAANVASVFSDTYTDEANVNYNSQGDAQFESINLNGNEVLRYHTGNFSIIEIPNKIDAVTRGMTNLRFDAWFANEVTESAFFLLKVVNSGIPKSEAIIKIDDGFDPAMKQGQWITFDFSFEELQAYGMQGFNDINQIVLDIANMPDVYIDNMYLYQEQLNQIEDATLSDLQVDGQTINEFSPAVFSYNYEVALGTTPLPQLTATKSSPTAATPVITNITELPGTATVQVTAEDGVTRNTYEVNFSTFVVPTTAAASPTEDPADVFSIFSDSYQDVPKIGFNEVGAADFEIVDLGGNEALRYAVGETNFSIIDLGADNQLDLASKQITNFKFDVWFSKTIDPSSSFLLKVVNKDPASQTREAIITFNASSNPPITQGQWITYDFTLGDLASRGLIETNSIQEIVIDVLNTGEVYIDNMMFYSTGPPSTENLLTNGDFENGATAWTTNYEPFMPDVRTEGDNSFFFANVETAGLGFQVNLSQPGLSIVPNGEYTLSFTASTSAETGSRDIVVGIGFTESPFNNDSKAVTLTPLPTQYQLNLRAFGPGEFGEGPFGGDGNSRVLFDMGADVGVVVLDDVSLQIGANVPSSLATLNDLKVNDETVVGFDALTEAYSVSLPFNTTEIPVVSATSTNSSASIAITQATEIEGTATVLVTAADGETTKTYTLDFSIGAASTDATLSDLKIGDNTVAGFASDVLAYTATLPSGSTLETIPEITATPTNEFAADPVITTELNTEDENIFATSTIVVTAEDGITTESYKIDFSISTEAGDATLSDLQIDFGANAQPDFQTVEGFDPVTLNYDVALPFGTATTAVPEVRATPSFEGLPEVPDDGATVAIQDAASLPGTTTITVTSEDLSNTQDYTIAFTIAEASKDSTLTAITVGNVTVAGFNPQTFTYSVTLPTGTNAVPAVAGTALDANAQVSVTTSTELPGLATLVVTAENGTSVSTYKVKMTVAGDPNLLANGTFEFGADGSWFGNASNPVTEDGNTYNFADVATAGQAFQVNLSQVVPLVTNENYVLSFQASTSAGGSRTIFAGIGQNFSPFASSTKEITLTGTPQVFTFVLPASFQAGANSRVLFDMGADEGVVVIDKVRLTLAKSIAFPVTFEANDVAYTLIEFGGAPGTVQDNPSRVGINTSAKVAQTEKVGGPQAGTFFQMDAPINFSAGKVVFMKVYSPKANVGVRLRLENATNSDDGFELVDSVFVANEWVELSYDFTDSITNESLSKVILVFDPGNNGDGSKYYWDDISLVSPRADATLSSITVDDEPILDFVSATLNYEVEIPFGTTTVPTVAATANSQGAGVVITQASNLADSAEIVVTSIDQTNTSTYYVKFKFSEPSDDATLSDLKVDSLSVAGFNSDSLMYVVELPSGTTVIPQITEAITTNDSATVVITQAAQLPDTAFVVVTAQNDSTTLTYQVVFNLLDANKDATLSELRYDGALIPGFNALDTVYDVELEFGSSVPAITAVASNADAMVSITQADTIPGTATVVVTAPDGETKKTYRVSFFSLNNDATLSDLLLDGTTIDGFSPDTLVYQVSLSSDVTMVPTVTAVAADSDGATVSITNAQTLPDSAFVVVTAEDGTTSRTYTVVFTLVPPGTDATLSDLTVDGNTVTGFNDSTFAYTIELSEGALAVPSVDAVPTDENAVVVITPTSDIPGTTLVEVTAEDGITALEYSITFEISDNRAPVVSTPILDQVIVLNDTIEIDLSDIFEDPEGADLVYSFTNLRDQVVSVSIEDSIISIVGISEGTSTIDVTARDEINGAASTSFDVVVVGEDEDVLYDVAGKATADGIAFTEGTATLFDLNNLNNVFISELFANGGFAFSFVPKGDYYLYVSSTSSDYVTTVYGDVSTALDASAVPTTLEVNKNITGANISMVTKPTPAITFLDELTGGILHFNTRSVTSGGSRILEGNELFGDILPGVTVILSTLQNEYIADGVTNQRGYIRFSGLPTGTYRLTLDVPGVGRVSSDVSVEEGRQAYYSGLIDEDGIIISIATGIDDNPLSGILLYPSSAERELYIDLPEVISGQFELTITSLTGRVIYPSIQPGARGIIVQVDQLSIGMHIIRIATEQGTWSGKFFKK